ncbi:MAG: DUF6973 domain-containing protein [Planctomycetaceae bacterium]
MGPGDTFLHIDETIGYYLHTDNGWADITAIIAAGHYAIKDTRALFSGPDGIYDESTPLGRRGNAFRHCEWSCLMCKANGEKKALQAGIYHEVFGEAIAKGIGEWSEREKGEQLIDLMNNVEGLRCCKEAANCYECCLETEWWDWRDGLGRGPIWPQRPLPKPENTPPEPPGDARKGAAPTGERDRKEPPKDAPRPSEPAKPYDFGSDEAPLDRPFDESGASGTVALSTNVGGGRGDLGSPPPTPFRWPTAPPSGSFPPPPPNYDPCTFPSNACPGRGPSGGGGMWRAAQAGVACFLDACEVVAWSGSR